MSPARYYHLCRELRNPSTFRITMAQYAEQRGISASARAFAPRFFQAPPRGDTLRQAQGRLLLSLLLALSSANAWRGDSHSARSVSRLAHTFALIGRGEHASHRSSPMRRYSARTRREVLELWPFVPPKCVLNVGTTAGLQPDLELLLASVCDVNVIGEIAVADLLRAERITIVVDSCAQKQVEHLA